jgi:hypothetical protein
MPATSPTILATSAGYRPHRRLRFGVGPMMALAVELGTAQGPRGGIRAAPLPVRRLR